MKFSVTDSNSDKPSLDQKMRMLFPLAIFAIAGVAAQVLPIGVVLNLQTPLQIAGVALLNYTVADLNARNVFPVPIQLIVKDSLNSIRQAVLLSDAMVNQNNIVALIGEFPSGKIHIYTD